MRHFAKIPPASRGDGTFYTFVARRRSGATFDQAQAELDVLAATLLERYPTENSEFKTARARVFPGLGPSPLTRDRYRTMIERLLMIGAVLVVLGCANVANLLIFRGVRREREHAVRLALGAGRWRLLQLQLTESCLLTIAGGALGVALATGIASLIVGLMLPSMFASDFEVAVPIDTSVLIATLGVSIAAGLLAGVLPGWIGANRPMIVGLSQAGGRGTPRGRHVRAGFASLQLALSLALLVGALLMVETVRKLSSVELGFDPDGVTVHSVSLGSQGYTPARAVQYLGDLHAGLAAAPGVSAASFSYSYPLSSAFFQNAHRGDAGAAEPIEVRTNAVTDQYFDVVGVPIVEGRGFTREEATALGDRTGNGVVVAKALAARLFGEAPPLGRTIVVGSGTNARTVVVVGVAGDVRADLEAADAELTIYEPLARTAFFAVRPTILVRSQIPLTDIVDLVRTAAARIDAAVPIYGHRPLQDVVDRRLADQRVFASVLSLLGALGFVLAAVGVYGLLSQAVAERTREFGIRMAIGASRQQVFGLVLRHAAIIGAIGGVAGLALAFFGTRLIEPQLWGVTAHEPSVYVAAIASLLAVVFAAAAWPARAATRVEPVAALRTD